jgi:CRISPR-associated protein Cas5h
MSPLSFSIPSRTALSGIIGAILGIDKANNPESFNDDNSFMALRVMNPVKKTKIAHNYLKTGSSLKQFYDFSEHKPTNVEFLKDVRYRIYFAHSDIELYQKLKGLLLSHQCVYTISLGISGCLAGYEFLGEYKLTDIDPNCEIEVHTIIPFASIEKIDFSGSVNLQKVTIPAIMKNDREVIKYEEVLFEQNAATIKAVLNDTAFQVECIGDIIHGF